MKSTAEIRHGFLNFFEKQGHKIVSSSSLIPQHDPSLMFTNSGMVQFKDIFLGKESATASRATSCQKCLRAGGKHNDLDNVGYTKRHLTFFEMLGNFSFGDYFKEQAILYSWQFISRELGLDPSRLYITVYHDDTEAFALWKKISEFPDEKIIRISTKDNFWSMGDTGPCGPCSEIFYDQGSALKGGLPGSSDQDGDRYVEIWNLVFMQFEQNSGGTITNLSKQSIDTGMGLERIAAVAQGVYDNFEIDLFRNLIKASAEISGAGVEKNLVSHRVIADHLRACAFLVAEGIIPSNEGRGYVMRRILRRAIRHTHKLECKEPIMYRLVPTLVNEMGATYSELVRHSQLIERVFKEEEESFRMTLDSGMALLNTELASMGNSDVLSGEVAFKLHDTYGFPVDLTIDILREQQGSVDMESFEKCMAAQRQASRKAWIGSGAQTTEKLWFDIKGHSTEFVGYKSLSSSGKVLALVQENQIKDRIDNTSEFFMIVDKTPFFGESGGQAGDRGWAQHQNSQSPPLAIIDTIIPIKDLRVHKCILEDREVIAVGDLLHLQVDIKYREDVKRNHTATHLLHAALRDKLGDSVVQKGSSVKHDGFRFDFSYGKPLTRTVINEIEIAINDLILKNLSVTTTLMAYEDSLKSGAMALFGEKYDKEVRVVQVGDQNKTCSMELCGGTHVSSLGEIGIVKILSEEAIASGVRRIEAISGSCAFRYLQNTFDELKEVTKLIQAEDGKALERIKNILDDQKQLIKDTTALKQKLFIDRLYSTTPEVCSGISLLCLMLDSSEDDVRPAVQKFLSEHQDNVVLLLSYAHEKTFYMVGVGSKLHSKIGADYICKEIANQFSAKGGGNKLIAQGNAQGNSNIKDKIKELVATTLNGL